MKELFGCSGRKSGLTLRIGQCAFAAASIGAMASVPNPDLASPSAFRYLVSSMGLLVLWSFGHACFDMHALRVNMDLYTLLNVRMTVVGDWVLAMLSLAAACSSAGVIVLYSRDTVMCSSNDNEFACSVIQMSVLFAFMSWSLVAVSSYLMLCLLATL